MIEVWLFIVVGVVAVAAATMMLLSENAVHSALFLILNFACVAFMYLMLEAPFLAMVQIAVYAGAIMVLFLFVIMLLGAERAESETTDLRNLRGSSLHTPVAMVLALVLLVTAGVAISRGEVAGVRVENAPQLRVVHYAGAAERVNVSVDGQLVAEDLPYREATTLVTVAPGEHEILVSAVTNEGEGEVLWSGNITVEASASESVVTTAVLYGLAAPELATFTEDLVAPPNGEARVVVFNGFREPVSLQDRGVFGRANDGRVLISGLEAGTVSEPLLLPAARTDRLRFVRPADEGDDSQSVNALLSMDRTFGRESSTLIVLTELGAGSVPDVGFTVMDTAPVYGGPKAVGQVLFTRYLLPLQMVGLLLLAALVGVIVIAQRQVSNATVPSAARKAVRRRVSRPLTSVIASQVTTDSDTDTPQLTSGD